MDIFCSCSLNLCFLFIHLCFKRKKPSCYMLPLWNLHIYVYIIFVYVSEITFRNILCKLPLNIFSGQVPGTLWFVSWDLSSLWNHILCFFLFSKNHTGWWRSKDKSTEIRVQAILNVICWIMCRISWHKGHDSLKITPRTHSWLLNPWTPWSQE